MEVVETGYKMTEVGLIPEDWKLVPLSQMSEFITKGSTPTTYGYGWEKNGILFLRSECVSDSGLDLAQSMFISDIANKSLSRSIVKGGDILITITGNVGRVVLLPCDIEMANINQHIARIRIIKEAVSHLFIYHILSQNSFRKYFESIVTGQAYPQISLTQVREADIPLPPTLSEQKAIATALSDVDALITSLDRLIEKKKAIKQGAMQDLLTPSSNSRIVKLGRYAQMSSGGTPSSKVDEYYDGEIIWISISDITNSGKYISNSSKKISQKGLENSSAKMFPTGTVFLAMYASIGKCAIITKEASTSQAILGITPNNQLINEYLYYFLTFNKEKNASQGQQGTQSNLNKGMVQEIDIVLPSIHEQEEIVEILSSMDSVINRLETKRDKYDQIKQGMMQELLTGKTRLI